MVPIGSLLTFVLLTAACGEPREPERRLGGDVRDSAGVVVAENRQGVAPSGVAASLEAELTVGAREGPAAFGRVSSVDLGADGELYVLSSNGNVYRLVRP